MYFVCYSVWTLVAVVGVTFYAFKLIEHVIGAPVELRDYISNHFALTPLISNPNTKRPFDDNLCFCFFVFCFSVSRPPQRIQVGPVGTPSARTLSNLSTRQETQSQTL